MVWAPMKTHGSHGEGFHLQLNHQYQPLRRNEDAFAQRVHDVVTLLDGPMPEPSNDCGYCNWFVERNNY